MVFVASWMKCSVFSLFFMPPKESSTKSNTLTFGTKHFFAGDLNHPQTQVFDFVEGHFWYHFRGYLKPCVFLACTAQNGSETLMFFTCNFYVGEPLAK